MFVEAEVEFVNSQIDHHRKSIAYHEKRGDQPKVNRHRGILKRFEDLLPKIERLVGVAAPSAFEVKEVKVG
ncbi:MAG TPA: hypothetical protein VGN36_00875, partial [Sphingorhabdus sp.]|nr:hypothetical protein [Sphingorhabdus sp.]